MVASKGEEFASDKAAQLAWKARMCQKGYPVSQHGKYIKCATSTNFRRRTFYMLLTMAQKFLEEVGSLGRLSYLAGPVA